MGRGFDLKKTRNSIVAKDNRIIQHGRNTLTKMESKAIAYLVAKIQPDDGPNKIYIFNCQEFQALLRWNKEASYQNIKKMLKKLGDASFWCEEERKGRKKDVLLRWLNIVRMDPGNGEIEISFHPDMYPYLLNLREQQLNEEKSYFSSYKLQSVSLFKYKYTQRIYELLKSYSFNNRRWFFENGTGTEYDLQVMIAITETDEKTGKMVIDIPEGWSNWAIFKRNVLDPAIKEINKFTDLRVAYKGKKEDTHHRKTRAIRTVEFYMDRKTAPEQKKTDDIIDAAYRNIENEENYHQMTIEELFFEERSIKHKEEEEYFEAKRKEKEVNKAKHPTLFAELNRDRNANFDEKKVNLLYNTAVKGRIAGKIGKENWELFATDLILHYYDKIAATPEETKSSVLNRLLDCVKNDYDNMAEALTEEYRGQGA